MYAVFTTGGKQYKASANDVLYIEKLDVENGLMEASGTIDCIKYSGSEGFVKRIFK